MAIVALPQQNNMNDLLKIFLMYMAQTQGTEATKGAAGRAMLEQVGTEGVKPEEMAALAEGTGTTPEALQLIMKKTVAPTTAEKEVISTTPRFDTTGQIIDTSKAGLPEFATEAQRTSFSYPGVEKRAGAIRASELAAQTANIIPSAIATAKAEEAVLPTKLKTAEATKKGELGIRERLAKETSNVEKIEYKLGEPVRKMKAAEEAKYAGEKEKVLAHAGGKTQAEIELAGKHGKYYDAMAQYVGEAKSDSSKIAMANAILKAEQTDFQNKWNASKGTFITEAKDKEGKTVATPKTHRYFTNTERDAIFERANATGIPYTYTYTRGPIGMGYDVTLHPITPPNNIDDVFKRVFEKNWHETSKVDKGEKLAGGASASFGTKAEQAKTIGSQDGLKVSPMGLMYKKVGDIIEIGGKRGKIISETPKINSRTGKQDILRTVQFDDGTMEFMID